MKRWTRNAVCLIFWVLVVVFVTRTLWGYHKGISPSQFYTYWAGAGCLMLATDILIDHLD